MCIIHTDTHKVIINQQIYKNEKTMTKFHKSLMTNYKRPSLLGKRTVYGLKDRNLSQKETLFYSF